MLLLLILGAILLMACLFVIPPVLVRPWSDHDLSVVPEKDRPQLQNDRMKLRNDVRTTLAQALGGAVLLIGAYLTWQQIQDNQLALQRNLENTQAQIKISQDQTSITQKGEITNRLAQAVSHLGNTNLAVRIGAAYELERIAKDSEGDRGTVLALLVGLVREHSPRRLTSSNPTSYETPKDTPRERYLPARAPDVQAAMTVLGRRASYETPGTGGQSQRPILSATDLRGADLRYAHLEDAELTEANLQRADLRSSFLGKADLRNAILEESLLHNADLDEVNLQYANLRGAKANRRTTWPPGFNPQAAGVIIEEG